METANLKKIMNSIGIRLLLIYLISSLAIILVLSLLTKVLGLPENTGSTAIVLVQPVISVLIFAKYLHGFLKKDTLTQRQGMDSQLFLQLLILTFGTKITTLLTETGASDPSDEQISWMILLFTCIAAPICEELVFRGAIMHSLARFSGNFAIFMSALLFSLYHGSLSQIPHTFLAGLLFGYVAWRYSLKWSILLHLLSNSFAMLASLLEISDRLWSLLLILCFLFSLFLLYLHRNTIHTFITTHHSRKGTYPEAFKAVWLLIFIILMIAAVIFV